MAGPEPSLEKRRQDLIKLECMLYHKTQNQSEKKNNLVCGRQELCQPKWSHERKLGDTQSDKKNHVTI